MQIFRLVDSNDTLHIFLLHQVDYLSTVGNNFQGCTGHQYLFIIEDFPIMETMHNPHKNLIIVLVHWRMLITQLFRLIKQSLAKKISFNLNRSLYDRFLTRVVVSTHFVFFLDLLNNSTLPIFLTHGALIRLISSSTNITATSRSLLTIIVLATSCLIFPKIKSLLARLGTPRSHTNCTCGKLFTRGNLLVTRQNHLIDHTAILCWFISILLNLL